MAPGTSRAAMAIIRLPVAATASPLRTTKAYRSAAQRGVVHPDAVETEGFRLRRRIQHVAERSGRGCQRDVAGEGECGAGGTGGTLDDADDRGPARGPPVE